MPDKRARVLKFSAWGLSIFVVLLSFFAWGQHLHWKFSHLSTYSLFPLFGLLAFSLMWSHYIVAAVRKRTGLAKDTVKTYVEVTGLAVLAFLLLHPGLLIWQLWRDGYGLPPSSYEAYVAKSMVWVVILGTISLFVFLAYETHRVYKDKPWWKFVQYASDAAMLAILYHSLKLGSTLHRDWLTAVWYIYGISYIAALVYLYLPVRSKDNQENSV